VPTPPPPPPVDSEKAKQALHRKPRASCQDFELRFFSSLKEVDPLISILSIPPDDIKVVTQKRTFRTVEDTVPVSGKRRRE